MTYETFFGLKEKPFSLSSDPRFLYRSHSHAVAYDELLAGIRRGEGLLVLTGDIGTGKTTLCRAALENLDRKTFSAFVPDPFASREDLLKMLLVDFGVMSIQDLATGPLRGASRTELSYFLHAFLETLVPLEAFVVVIIDEAQNMSLPLIEEIRILSDMNGRQSPLQVVFVGQLELHDRLKLPEMRQVDQRVCVYARLDPLSADAVPGYVRHRLQIAGGTPDRVKFPADSFDLLYRASRGVPRLINRICDRALHLACLRHTSTVDPDIVAAALDDIGQPRPALPTPVDVPTIAPAVLTPAVSSPVMSSPVVLSPVVLSTDALSAPEPQAVPHSTHVRQWLKRVEVNTQPSAPLGQFKSEADPSVPDALDGHSADLFSDLIGRDENGDDWRPEKHMQRMRRRWFKRARATASWVAALVVLVIGTGYLRSAVAQAIEPPTLPSIPAKPALPAPAALQYSPAGAGESGAGAGHRYVVEVALFTTSERADRLIEVLTREQFTVFQQAVRLGSGRIFQQVLIGPFTNRADADANLQRLQQTNGFADARVAETDAASAPAAPGESEGA
jgi:type II secretory pathway predicted ATPase ExeA